MFYEILHAELADAQKGTEDPVKEWLPGSSRTKAVRNFGLGLP